MAGQGNLVPVYRAVQADLETPVSAYLKVARPPYSFLLESVEGGERLGRYSFIGTEPYKVVKTGPGQLGGEVDPLVPVRKRRWTGTSWFQCRIFHVFMVVGWATWPMTRSATSSPACP